MGIFNLAPGLILSINRQGIIVDCNQRIHNLLGYSKTEIIGQPVSALVPPDHHAGRTICFPKPRRQATPTPRPFRWCGRMVHTSMSASGPPV